MMKTTLSAIVCVLLSGCGKYDEPEQSEFDRLLEIAQAYGKENHLSVLRTDPPHVEVISQKKMDAKEPHDSRQRLGCCNFDAKTIFVLSRKDKEVLYHEYGHWFFGRYEDPKEKEADAFAEYAIKEMKR